MNNPFEEGGGTAFPLVYDDEIKLTKEIHSGMTMRDWFAGKAMQGMLAAAENYQTIQLADYAYSVADAMLKERSKQ
jgi:hypothetical protein